GEVAGPHEAGVEPAQGARPGRLAVVDGERACETGRRAEVEAHDGGRCVCCRPSQATSRAKDQSSKASATAARPGLRPGGVAGAISTMRTTYCTAQTVLRRSEGKSGAASQGRTTPAPTNR